MGSDEECTAQLHGCHLSLSKVLHSDRQWSTKAVEEKEAALRAHKVVQYWWSSFWKRSMLRLTPHTDAGATADNGRISFLVTQCKAPKREGHTSSAFLQCKVNMNEADTLCQHRKDEDANHMYDHMRSEPLSHTRS